MDLPWRGKFLFHAASVAKVFRGIFIKGLKRLYRSGSLVIPDSMDLSAPGAFELYLEQVTNRKWNVYAKPPFSGPEQVIHYIGRYTHRTAISNRRLLSIDKGTVAFTYKDYKKNPVSPPTRIMRLPVNEFISRYLDHFLPDHYHEIRFFGFMANGRRAKNLEIARRSIARQGTAIELNDAFIERFEASLQTKDKACPCCRQGIMRPTIEIKATGYSVTPVPDDCSGTGTG